MAMDRKELFLELGQVGLALAGLSQGRGHGTHRTVDGKGATASIIEAVKELLRSYGIGQYDETEVSKLFYTALDVNERKLWTALQGELTGDERKTLNLHIFLMERDVEIHDTPATKAQEAKGDKPAVPEQPAKRVTKPVGEDIRAKFMKAICADIAALGDDGPKQVAEMFRTNKLIGEESAIKRYQATVKDVTEKLNTFLNRLETEHKKEVPMNILTRMTRAGVAGPKLINPEPIMQGDGIKNAIKRMLGMRTRSK